MSSTQYVDVERTLDNLETSQLHPDDVAAITAFVDHCAAEGLSAVRQERLAVALKSTVLNFAPDDFRLPDAPEAELKSVIANLNRSEYTDSTKHTMRSALKKFYKVENGGHKEPEKTKFFSVGSGGKTATVTREDLFTDEELDRLFRAFNSTRDRALVKVMYESAARPGEALDRTIADFTANGDGDFIYLEGLKDTPDRTNQLVRAGRTLREWLAQHPFGGELGAIEDPSAPLWVKTEQQACTHCGKIPHDHPADCAYAPDLADPFNYAAFLRRFKQACEAADIPDNKRRPYNLRHTRLTEVATFMGYEQLNKFAGWKPGSDRAKVYVHLNNDDVNRAIRDQYGLGTDTEDDKQVDCPFCGATNQSQHAECRQCGRPLQMEAATDTADAQALVDRLRELERKVATLDELDLDRAHIKALADDAQSA
jgi:integrase